MNALAHITARKQNETWNKIVIERTEQLKKSVPKENLIPRNTITLNSIVNLEGNTEQGR